MIRFGPLTLSTYTLILDAAIAAGLVWLWWSGRRDNMGRRWLDAGLFALAGGLIGARAAFVALNWAYFGDHLVEAVQIWTGGLNGHGALIGAVMGGWLGCKVRRVDAGAFFDAAAPIFPLLVIAGWAGCRVTACGYGAEVRSLADPSPIAVAELHDIYRVRAPRYDTQLYGILLGGTLMGLAAIMARRGVRGRLWPLVILYALGAFAIGFWRGDPVPQIGPLRADQALDLAVGALALILWLARLLKRPDRSTVEAVIVEEGALHES
jgi:phosphatidylglycerol:prolipoprotein diacylglycerol transferase